MHWLMMALFMDVLSQESPVARQVGHFDPPAGIVYRATSIMSEGSRLSAETFVAKEKQSYSLPTLILSHGWGGQASLLRADAVAFAQAGYFVVTFDYRGWGASDGRLIATEPVPANDGKRPMKVAVRELREMVDPHDQLCDLMSVIHWVQGEANSDPERLGLWGTSYSGGHVVYAAAKDHRVKAIVAQVPALDSRLVIATPEGRAETFRDATARARGELEYPPPGQRVVGNLKGAPIREKMMRYAPVELASEAPQCAMLFIIAGKEELFDNKDHALKAFDLAVGPKKVITIPGITHYGVYLQARKRCQQEAVAWFNEHLKVKESASAADR
ncbi:alpha/beta fold hydrolase [bacterium]|nr:alpha/beta fold hydrolase [bacterium]